MMPGAPTNKPRPEPQTLRERMRSSAWLAAAALLAAALLLGLCLTERLGMSAAGSIAWGLFALALALSAWYAGRSAGARRAGPRCAHARGDDDARLRPLIAQAPCLLWSADLEERGGELLFWEMKLADPEAAQRFFPLNIRSADEYQQTWYFSRLAEDRLRTDALGSAEIRAGRSYRQEFRCRRADGEIRWFAEEIQVETVAPGRWRAAGVCTDITDFQHREEQLLQRIEGLARADRSKDQFLAVLAHELRNPIGAISNALQLLKLRAGADARLSRSLEVIERQVEHQARLLDDLLDVSRIGRGKLALNLLRLDLAELIREVAEDHRSALERAGLSLHLKLPDEPVWLMADPTRLAQVLTNLLQNAAKFTDPGGQVSVTLGLPGPNSTRRHGDTEKTGEVQEVGRAGSKACSQSAPQGVPPPLSVSPCLRVDPFRAILTVSDTGIGIEPEFLPHLFESFMQAERTRERSRAGLGLGLALVKGLVELHGGTVSGHSDGPGTGAAFTLELPLADPPAPAEALAPAAPAPTGAWRILIVEDNPDAAVTLQDLLEALGCRVAVASSGTEAIEQARQFQPEVVLCDLGLPDIDGCQVAQALRQLPATASASLIAVSGYGQEEDRRRSQQAGFDRHLTKPLNFDELRQLLELTLHGQPEPSG